MNEIILNKIHAKVNIGPFFNTENICQVYAKQKYNT